MFEITKVHARCGSVSTGGELVKPDLEGTFIVHGSAPTLEAMARFISAAPDLLRVAELILKEWERPTEGVLPGELIARLSQYSNVAREAICKATKLEVLSEQQSK